MLHERRSGEPIEIVTLVDNVVAKQCRHGQEIGVAVRQALGELAILRADLFEPFSGIDPIAVADLQSIIRELKERGYGILLTDHNVRETLSITDRAYLIYEGKVFLEGKPDYITENKDARKFYLGEDFSW